jgi:membrane associated rhomboid family serine protease
MSILRRVRGVLATALTWATGWTVIAWPVFYYLLPRVSGFARVTTALRMAGYAGLAGAVTGATFALMVVFFERRSTLSTFRTSRAAFWGAAAGSAYSIMLILRSPGGAFEPASVLTAGGVVGAVLGGATAALMLRLAQRAESKNQERLSV